jgi:hypothetical protein
LTVGTLNERIVDIEIKTEKKFNPRDYERCLFIDESYLSFNGLRYEPFANRKNSHLIRTRINSYKPYHEDLKVIGIGIGRLVTTHSDEGPVYGMDMLFCGGFVSYRNGRAKPSDVHKKQKNKNRHKKNDVSKGDNHWELVGVMSAKALRGIVESYQEDVVPTVYVCTQSEHHIVNAMPSASSLVRLVEINGGDELGMKETFEYELKQEAGIEAQRRLWIELDEETRRTMMEKKKIFSLRYGKPLKEMEFLRKIISEPFLEPLPPII